MWEKESGRYGVRWETCNNLMLKISLETETRKNKVIGT